MSYIFLFIGCAFIGTSAVLVYLLFIEINSISYDELRNITINIKELQEQKKTLKETKKKMIIDEFKDFLQGFSDKVWNPEDRNLMEYENTLELARKRIRNSL